MALRGSPWLPPYWPIGGLPPPLAPTLNTPTVMRFCLLSVRHVKKDEKRYYEELLRYSREHLMLYPYHLSDVIVRGLRVTPFSYYCSVMADIMAAEKSYDALPNFTAADCKALRAAELTRCTHRALASYGLKR